MGIVRFLLALSVVLFHLGSGQGLRPMGGWVAVEGFFVISGFYMALVLANKYPATPMGSAVFYANRYLRLYPTYFVVLVLMTTALAFFGTSASSTYSLDKILGELRQMDFTSVSYILGANLIMFGADLAGFLGDVGHDLAYLPGPASIPTHYYMIIPQGWTIGLELTFYLVAPVLLRLQLRWLFVAAIGSLALRLVLPHAFGLPLDPWAHTFFPFVLFLFLMGALAQRLRLNRTLLRSRLRVLVLWAVLLAYIVFYRHVPGGESIRYWGFLGLLTASIYPVFEFSRSLRWDRFLGELSYPLYLCHFLVQYVVDNTLGPSHLAVKIFGSIGLAALLYFAIDRNVDILRAKVAEYLGKRRPTGVGRLPSPASNVAPPATGG